MPSDPRPLAASAAVPSSREQLWAVLAEAAEIEHNLMCCYLYAFFSLKQRIDEDLTAQELAAIERWRGEILDIAIEEMAHLAIVSNILSGLGAPAHYGRQNFPIPPGYHPADIVVKLAPFNVETLDHFIYLERPESVQLDDGSGFEPERRYARGGGTAGRLMTFAFDYATVGELYAAIKTGLQRLAAVVGEEKLFVGDAQHQIGPDVLALDNLVVVRDLQSACAAIDAIVRQGEGSHPDETGSHYQRFRAMRDEYEALRTARPAFKPGRPAAHNPVMRRPPTPEGKMWIDAEPAATVLDFGNAVYAHALRCLAMAYDGVDKAVQRVLVDSAIELMRVLTPIATCLTTLPASTGADGCTAGISFATLRSYAPIPAVPGGLAVIAERLEQIAAQASALPGESLAALGADTAARCRRLAARIGELRASAPERAAAPADAAPEAGEHAIPTPISSEDGVDVIPGKALDLLFDTPRCIHSRHCVLTLPKVFKANVEGPWIDPDAASTQALVTVAHLCPSGAIRYRRKDGGEDEQPPAVNLVQLRENGPLGIRAQIVLDGREIGMRATLCRCGASKNKPFCDGSHNGIAFSATGEPETRESAPLAARAGPLRIDPETNGPYRVTGNLELCSGTGRTINRVQTTRLCRCGGSANKPYCDNTHRRIGFKSG